MSTTDTMNVSQTVEPPMVSGRLPLVEHALEFCQVRDPNRIQYTRRGQC